MILKKCAVAAGEVRKSVWAFLVALTAIVSANMAAATDFTMNVPGTSLRLPDDYPEAGGVAIVLVGQNGNAYYQFSNPAGAFRGFQYRGTPTAFRGNPFTINNPISLDCGASTCGVYFGGSIAQAYIRFTAYDGDTQTGGFDEDDISLRLNGFTVGNWSDVQTQITNNSGTSGAGFQQGFGNNSLNTGWFTTSNPGLLSNILSVGSTTTQVFDDDPDDNYWDFTIGNSLSNSDIITVAPGYTLDKQADTATFTSVGQTINYTYTIANIGSVPIRQISVSDDKISSIDCGGVSQLLDVNFGQSPNTLTCTASYQVTQEDFDNQAVTNIASVTGVPDFGTLGVLTDSATVTGPSLAPGVEILKTTTATAFGNAGTTVPYQFVINNTGNTTLRNIQVSDPNLPFLTCNVPDLVPQAPNNTFTCTGTYTVKQTDVDTYAADTVTTAGQLQNTATVTATAPNGATFQDTASTNIPGPDPVVSMTFEKEVSPTTFSEAEDLLSYTFRIVNNGNVTWPGPPTIMDADVANLSCPSGPVAPNATVLCSASYEVQQQDVDAGEYENTAEATISAFGETDTKQDTVTATADRVGTLSIVKRLAASSATSFDETSDTLTYEYVLTNTGNVTLEAASVTDNRVNVDCPPTDIAPDGVLICTSDPFSPIQADLNAGEVTNTASASATEAGPNGDQVTSPQTSLTVQADQQPALEVAKTAPTVLPQDFLNGTQITYSFEVTNVGNVDLTSAIAGASAIEVTDNKIGVVSCGSLPLNIGDSVTCTATYTISQADQDAGVIQNTATASAGTVTSPEVSAQVSPVFEPAITVQKNALTTSVSALGDVLNYEFVVTNTGNTTLTLPDNQVTINDPDLSAPADCSAQPAGAAGLPPNGSFICVGSRTGVTQPELDSGQIENTASAQFDFTSGGQTVVVQSDEVSATIPVTQTGTVDLQKTGPATYNALNQQLSYTFEVTNNTNVTLTTATVTDPLIPGLSCTLTDIGPGLSQSCTGTYPVSQTDMDDETIMNTASVAAQPAVGGQLQDTGSFQSDLQAGAGTKLASMIKLADTTQFTGATDQITYTMQVTNDGTQTLTDLVVTDSLNAGFSCTIPTLAPQAVNDSCTFIYNVTQADLDNGSVDNTATLNSPDLTAPVQALRSVDGPTRTPAYTFEKRASGGYSAINDDVDYTFVVTNTGNVTLTAIEIVDPLIGPTFSCIIPTLAPGAQDTSCVGSITVQQPEIDAGEVTNTATVNSVGTPAGVTPPASQDASVTVLGPAERADVQITKTPSATSYSVPPDSITYTYEVTNTGNVTLSNLEISDPALAFTCTLAPLGPNQSTSTCLSPAGPAEETKTILQADVDAGSYTNLASVTGESQTLQTPVADNDQVTVDGPTQAPGIGMVKNTTFTGPLNAVRQTITYTFTVSNTGNITITAPIMIDDPLVPNATCPALPAAGLAPGGTPLVCTGTLLSTQAHLDAGGINNVAEANALQPVVPVNPGDPTSVSITSGPQNFNIAAQQNPNLFLAKQVKDGTSSSFSGPTDQITFVYTVTNNGNVTTTGPVTIDDNQIGNGLPCVGATDFMAPGDIRTCEHVWTADQNDVNAGEVTNVATANMTFNSAPVQSNSAEVTVTAVQTPRLSVDKIFDGSTGDPNFNPGDTLSYRFVVTNTGNVSFPGALTFTDNITTPAYSGGATGDTFDPTVSGDTFDPGEIVTYTATHVVDSNDFSLGTVQNVATVSADFDGQTITSDPDSTRYPIDVNPAMSLTKVVDTPVPAPFDDTTDQITYRYTVENTGNVALVEPIFINDDVIGRFECTGAAPLTTGSTADCTFTYTITQDDLDRGFVTNNATAQTVFAPSGSNSTDVESEGAQVTVNGATDPEMTVAKSLTLVNGLPVTSPMPELNDILTYTLTATNTGNQTLSGVSLTDTIIDTLTCSATGNVVLAPTAPNNVLTCTGTYTVTQADVDRQQIENTANARGNDPSGGTISGSDIHTQDLIAADVQFDLEKRIIPAPSSSGDPAFSAVGQDVTFGVSVTNEGNITLNTVTVDEVLPGRTITPTSCTVGPLLPGETDDTCRFTYIVLQTDLDEINTSGADTFAGFTNRVEGTGVPNNATLDDALAEDEVFVRGPDREPGLSLGKAANVTALSTALVGQDITYTYTIINTGNVTLEQEPVLTDDKINNGAPLTCAGFPAGGLPPLDFYECTAPYTVTQADLDNGGVTNNATLSSTEVAEDSEASLTLPFERAPALTFGKEASETSDVGADEEVVYTYTVANTGNVTLTAVTVTDQHTTQAGTGPLTVENDTLTIDGGEPNDSEDTSGPGIWTSLAPGDTITFEARYTLTQADVDAQEVISNVATVTAQGPAGTSNPTAFDQEQVTPETKVPGVEVRKNATGSTVSNPAQTTDTIVFNIEVENTGNQTLTDINLTDVFTDGLSSALDLTTGPTPAVPFGDSNNNNELDVDEIWTYRATYSVEQEAINTGAVLNSVSVSARDPQNQTVLDELPTPLRVDLPIDARIGLVKTSTLDLGPDGEANPGDRIIYRYELSNLGNVPVIDPVISETGFEGAGSAPSISYDSGGSAIAGTALPDLAVGSGTIVWTAEYLLEQNDLNLGVVLNQATVDASTPLGAQVSDLSDDDTAGPTANDKTATDLPTVPELQVEKRADVSALSDPPELGEVVVYTITVANTGNVTLEQVNLTDTLLDADGGALDLSAQPVLISGDNGNSQLDVEETWTYRAEYALTQEAFDAGGFTNSVSVTANVPGTTDPVTDVSDDDNGATDGPDAGSAPDDDPVLVTLAEDPQLVAEKRADLSALSDPPEVGETITFTISVQNTGNQTLRDLSVRDTLLDANGDPLDLTTTPSLVSRDDPNAQLDVGETWVYEATFDIDQQAIEAGGISNSVLADAAGPNDQDIEDLSDDDGGATDGPDAGTDPDDDPVVVEFERISQMTVEKRAFGVDVTDPAEVGQTIRFEIDVANTGNVSLSDISMADTLTTISGDPLTLTTLPARTSAADDADGDGELDPGEVWTFEATFELSQGAIDAGGVSNTALASGTGPDDVQVEDVSDDDGGASDGPDDGTAPDDDPTVFAVTGAAQIAVVKTVTVDAGDDDRINAGDAVTYGFVVTNTGNRTLFDVALAEETFGGTGTAPVIEYVAGGELLGGVAATPDLPVGEAEMTFTAGYILTQEDVDAGEIANQARVTAADSDGESVTDLSDESGTTPADNDATLLTLPAEAALQVVKTATPDLSDPVIPGDTIAYVVTVANIGTVSVQSLSLTDELRDSSGELVTPAPELAFVDGDTDDDGAVDPGEVWQYGGTLTLTQQMIDAGGVANSATAIGSTPGGETVEDVSDDTGDLPSDSDPTTTTFDQSPQMAVVKTGTLDVGADGGPSVGDLITYTYTVHNTGNVTLFDVTVAETGWAGTGDAPTPTYDAGGEDLGGAAPLDLAPGTETIVFTATYALEQGDLDNAEVVNQATGLANDPTGEQVSDLSDDESTDPGEDDETVVAFEVTPEITVQKMADVSGLSDAPEAGEEIVFTIMAANTGTVSLSDIALTDVFERADGTPLSLSPEFVEGDTGVADRLDVGETWVYRATYALTQEDIDAGGVSNSATVAGATPGGETISDQSDDGDATDGNTTDDPTEVTLDAAPELVLEKRLAADSLTTFDAVDQVINYEFEVTNTGNTSLTDQIVIADPLITDAGGTISCPELPEIGLAPDASLICVASYTVTQIDLDAGSIDNTATATSGDVTSEVSEVSVTGTQTPSLTFTKTASPSPFGEVGTDLVYSFSVENTGNVTLTNVEITDVLDDAYSCTVDAIEPLTTDATCTLTLVVTQDMVDAGELENSATVTADTPGEETVTETTSITTDGPTQEAGIEAVKTITDQPGQVGDQVVFRLEVSNVGNVTVSDVSLVDVMTRADGESISLDAPFALVASSDTDGDGALDVDEIWIYTAARTVTQEDFNAGGLTNSVTASGQGPDDQLVSDLSDNGNDEDGNTSDDPTALEISIEPELTVVKTVLETGAAAGESVVFQIAATNSGNVDLTDLTIEDNLTRADGTELAATAVVVDVPDTLAVDAVATWQVTHVLTQEDIDAGGLSNSAVVTANDHSDDPVSDVSTNGDPDDGNTEDDATQVVISPTLSLDTVKTVASIGSQVDELAVYQITVENTGNVTLTDVSVADTVTDFVGENSRSAEVVFDSNSATPPSPQGTLAPGETATYLVSVPLTLADIDAGGQSNAAVATASGPDGSEITDGSSPEPEGEEGPTLAEVTPLPGFAVTKTAGAIQTLFPTIEQVVFDITIQNTGNGTATGIVAEDDMSFLSPAALAAGYPLTVTAAGFGAGGANAGYDGISSTNLLDATATLEPGETGTITLSIIYSTQSGRPTSQNVVSVTSDQLDTPVTAAAPLVSVDTDGDGIPDGVEGTGDRDTDGVVNAQDYDPTGYFYCEEDGSILNGFQISVSGGGFTQTGVGTSGPIQIVQDGSQGFYQFFVTQPGTYTLSYNVPAFRTLSTTRFPQGTLVASSLLPAAVASLGSSEFGNSGELSNFSAAANPFHTQFVFAPGDPFIINNNIPLTQCEGASEVVASKEASRDTAVAGDTVGFTLRFANATEAAITGATIVDRLPTGMVYTPSTAVLNGVAQEPVINGQFLEWRGISLPVGGGATVTLQARVRQINTYGDLINRAYMLNQVGRQISNTAEAKVQIEPEAVFSCADVIGKVFDDGNKNGYQDGPDTLADITDQTYDGGKFAVAPQQQNKGEPGIAGVRVVTPDGLLITTDEFGRFSVPCAALPRSIGSNFMLKLDTRTLPTGYRVTTENPRVIRVTPGKMAKLNFGAALGRVVDIDLTSGSFAAGSTDVGPALSAALDGLIGQIANTHSVVNLTYILRGSETPQTGRARLRAVEKSIQSKWRGKGSYRLEIDKTVARSN